jgi:hypothetical protein
MQAQTDRKGDSNLAVDGAAEGSLHPLRKISDVRAKLRLLEKQTDLHVGVHAEASAVDTDACRLSLYNVTSEVAAVVNQACRTVALPAATNQGQRKVLGLSGSIEALTTSLENRVSDPERQELGCFAISMICSWTARCETQDQVNNRTVDAVVGAMLRHQHNERVQEEAARALIRIATNHARNTELVLASNAGNDMKLRIRQLARRSPASDE